MPWFVCGDCGDTIKKVRGAAEEKQWTEEMKRR
jgi:hypothetical protein